MASALRGRAGISCSTSSSGDSKGWPLRRSTCNPRFSSVYAVSPPSGQRCCQRRSHGNHYPHWIELPWRPLAPKKPQHFRHELLEPVAPSERRHFMPALHVSTREEVEIEGESEGTEPSAWIERIVKIARRPTAALLVGWTAAWTALTANCLVASDLAGFSSRTTASVAVIALVWLGMVSAISFLEAWVKYQAPLLTRPVAVDVGRHVFPTLNLVEWVHAIFLTFVSTYAYKSLAAEVMWRGTTEAVAAGMANRVFDVEMQELALVQLPGSSATVFFAWVLLLLVAVQRFWLLPKLDNMARHVIKNASPSDIPASRMVAQHWAADGAKEPKPAIIIHHVYSGVEVLKMMLLIAIAGWAIGLLLL